MGTSSSSGGPRGKTPLLPNWAPQPPSDPKDDDEQANQGDKDDGDVKDRDNQKSDESKKPSNNNFTETYNY